MYLTRSIEEKLDRWVSSTNRKPLLLRGARQVGKTSSIIQWGENRFENFVNLDFEKQRSLCKIFEGDLEPSRILGDLELHSNKRIIPGKTLLFLDEIQACPSALISLRYFFEEMPDLHIVAAGSLLEFTLGKVSFPVGRIESLYMYPLSFSEFLKATGKDLAAAQLPRLILEKNKILLSNNSATKTMNKIFFDALREYFVVGGMPEAVREYVKSKSFIQVSKVHEQLAQGFIDDIPKYASGDLQMRNLAEVFNYLSGASGKQIKYSKLSVGDNSIRSKNSIQLLEKAMLCKTVKSIDPSGLPLGANINSKQFKCIFVDIGLGAYMSGASAKDILASKNILSCFEGSLAEQFVGQQLISESQEASENGKLYTWIRAAKSSSSEVDYIVVRDSKIIPIEVKSGKSGRLRSLHLLLEKYPNVAQGVCLQEIKGIEKIDRISFLPLYTVI